MVRFRPLALSGERPDHGTTRRRSIDETPATTKPYVRRSRDESQFLRTTVQIAFLLLNLWIGGQFYLFVRYVESGGTTAAVSRPPGIEGWLPIAGLMNLKAFALTGELPPIHAAGLFLLMAFLAISLLARKAFCSWLCPIGTISEWLWLGGDALFGRTFRVWKWVDVPLRSLKYVLLGLFVWAVAGMSVDDLRAFLASPYGLIADVKLLDFFRHLGTTAAVVIGVLLVASVFVQNAWCRYLCPYGALMGLASLASPLAIVRNPDACIDCAKCSKACPSHLPVDTGRRVSSAECTACMLCIAACPSRDALSLSAGRRRTVPAWAVATTIAVIFFGLVGYAQLTGHWTPRVPQSLYFQLIPRVGQFGHP